jgi:hypothetical protein
MNSSIEIDEAVKLAEKLIARTREGKLAWEAVGGMASNFSGATAFTTKLEGNLKATVSIVKPEQDAQLAFSLVEVEFVPAIENPSLLRKIQVPDKEVLAVSVEKDPSYGYDTADEKQLAGLLIDLYGLARRSALKIDGSVQKALSYLDKIAV